MEGVERYKVRLLPHSDGWGAEFSQTKLQLQRIWLDNVLDIQHIGSTSIRDILAKPILDVAVVLKSFQNMNIEAMQQAGYDYCGLQKPDNDRYLFVLRGGDQISLRHIHCYEPNNRDFQRCIDFRDYLNSHPQDAAEYSSLKKELARRYPDNRFAYTDGKWEFVRSIYGKLESHKASGR